MDITQSQMVNIVNGPPVPAKISANSCDPQLSDFLASLSKPSDLSENPNIPRIKPTTAQLNTDGSLSHQDTLKSELSKEKHLLNRSRSSGGPFDDPKRGSVSSEYDVIMDIAEVQTGRTVGFPGSDDPFRFLLPTQDMHPFCESQKKADMTSGEESSKDFRSSNQKGMETTNSSV